MTTKDIPRIADRCPSCGNQTLFIGAGGWLTCSWIQCKEPGLTRAIAAQAAPGETPQALCPGCRKNPRGQSSPYCLECYQSWQRKGPATPPLAPAGSEPLRTRSANDSVGLMGWSENIRVMPPEPSSEASAPLTEERPLDRWGGTGAVISRGGVLGIGDEAWAELAEWEQRGIARRYAPTSGVSFSWRTFTLVMAALRAVRLEDFAPRHPHAALLAEIEQILPTCYRTDIGAVLRRCHAALTKGDQ